MMLVSSPLQEMKQACRSSISQCEGSRPTLGASWRINFSRVEKQGKVNWVWSPQVIWTPKQKRFAGS
eukprot:6468881-Amphidinium_carterae.2